MKLIKDITAMEDAVKFLNSYTDTYQLIAITQFNLSHWQEKKSINDSVKDVAAKIIEVSTRVIGDGNK